MLIIAQDKYSIFTGNKSDFMKNEAFQPFK